MKFNKNPDGACVLYAVANLTNNAAVLKERATAAGLLSSDLSKLLDKYLGPIVKRSVAVEPILVLPSRASPTQLLDAINAHTGATSSASSLVFFLNVISGGARHCVLAFYNAANDVLKVLDSTKDDKTQSSLEDYLYSNYVAGVFVVVDTNSHKIIYLNE
jgi:hypothetical protein